MKYTLSGSLIPFELEKIQRFKKRKEKLDRFLNIKIYHVIHSSLIIITSIHIDSMIHIRSTQSLTLIKILEYTHPPFCQSKLYPLSIFTYQKLDSHIHPSTFRLENSKSIRKTRFQIRKEREREKSRDWRKKKGRKFDEPRIRHRRIRRAVSWYRWKMHARTHAETIHHAPPRGLRTSTRSKTILPRRNRKRTKERGAEWPRRDTQKAKRGRWTTRGVR